MGETVVGARVLRLEGVEMKTVEDAVRQENGVWDDEMEGNIMIWKSGDIDYAHDRNPVDIAYLESGWQLVCTREQFEAEAERLRGKPKWDDDSKEYDWLWQNADGGWMFGNGRKPITEATFFLTDHHYPETMPDPSKVIGDWRDTLEANPMRELNPATSSVTDSQARELVEESGVCSEGKPCTDGVACNSCPNRNPVDDPEEAASKHSKYHVKIKGTWIDVYDILHAYQVTNPGDQHAIKKMLMPGKRGHKDAEKDRAEAIQSLHRAIELESTNG